MTGWRRDLLAAAAVEAAAGFAAAAWANALGDGHRPVAVFAACTLAAAAADMVLVPGCVWQRGPRAVVRLLARMVGAVATVATAVIVGIWMTFALLAFGSMALSFGDLTLDVGDFVLTVPFLSAGAVAGLGAALAERAKARPGIVRGRCRSHLTGGTAGVVLVLALALASGFGVTTPPAAWRSLLVLAPVTLVLGGGVRHTLMARDAVQTATTLADPDRCWCRHWPAVPFARPWASQPRWCSHEHPAG